MTIPSENLTPMAHAAQNRCFGCGKANPTGLLLDFLLAEDQSVVCNAIVPDTFEGPVGCVHGGIIATLLDEAMSKAVRARGLTAIWKSTTSALSLPSRQFAWRVASSAAKAVNIGLKPQSSTPEAKHLPPAKRSSFSCFPSNGISHATASQAHFSPASHVMIVLSRKIR
jgi:hypothetical protein